MSATITWNLQLAVREGQLEVLRGLMTEMVAATERDEPGTLIYEWVLADDNTTCHLYERYAVCAATAVSAERTTSATGTDTPGARDTPAAVRHGVVISYSHRDQRWLDLLQTHLRPYERGLSVSIWNDRHIRPGESWRSAIENAFSPD